jgi:hypothetical protein
LFSFSPQLNPFFLLPSYSQIPTASLFVSEIPYFWISAIETNAHLLFVSEIPYFWISAIETNAHLDFPKQIIACHARHTIICNNKIRFHFLEKHKKKKQRNSPPLVQISRKNKKKKGMESHRHTERERQTSSCGWPRPMEFMTRG